LDIFEKIAKHMGPIGQHHKWSHGYFSFPKLEGDIAPHMNFRGKEHLVWSLNNYLGLANHPEVRQGLVQSITQQDSPLLQSAIADVMLKLQEKRSVKSFEDLLKQKNLNPGVRDKIKQTITQLI